MPPTNDPPDAMMKALDAFQKAVVANNTEQAEAAAVSMLTHVDGQARQNPTPELALQEEACQCEATGDWAGAEAAYVKLLARHEVTGNPGLIFKEHLDLSSLFLLLGELDKAQHHGQAATAAAKQSDLESLQIMALENLARCALRRSDHAAALQAASEAVAIITPEWAQDLVRPGTLVLRARCRVEAGDVEGAEQDLAACRSALLEREISPIFAGTHSRVAGWWEVEARLCARRGDPEAASEAWVKAVEHRRHVASLPQVAKPYALAALARTLQSLGEALKAAGKTGEGTSALAEAQNLWCELGLKGQS